jgi:hypothetical protein
MILLGGAHANAWATTRPNWDHIPSSVRTVTVTFSLAGSSAKPVTFTSRAQLRPIVRDLNRVRPLGPGPHHCTGFFDPAVFRLVFRGSASGDVVARSTVYPVSNCSSIDLSIKGKAGPALTGGYGVSRLLVRLGTVANCGRRMIKLSSTGEPRRSSPAEDNGGERTLFVKDIGRRACAFSHQVRIRLLGKHRHALSVPVRYARAFVPWFIAPRFPARVTISWLRLCLGRSVHRVRLGTTQFRRSLSLALIHPFSPCRVRIAVSAATL